MKARIVQINPRQLQSLMVSLIVMGPDRRRGGGQRAIRFHDLDGDTRIAAIWYDYEQDTFEFMIEHPSFDDVPDGQAIPRIEGLDLSITGPA